MLKLPYILGIALLIFAASAWSQNPAKHEIAKIENPEQERNSDYYKSINALSPNKITVTQNHQTKSQECCKNENENGSAESWAAAGTVALAVITSFLALFTFKLWGSTSKLVQDARETSERQLRAYVWTETDFNGGISAQLGKIITTFKNTGQTPAYEVHVWTETKILDDPLPVGFVFENSPATINGPRYVINPGSIHTLNSTPDIPHLEDMKNSVIQGNKKLYHWGEVRYTDAFNITRRSRFRIYCSGAALVGMWVYCDEGNDAT